MVPSAGTTRFLLVLAFAGCTGPAREIAFITSGTTDQVFALDAHTGQVLDSLAVDPRPFESDEPHGIVADAEDGFLYVTAAHGQSTLWKFDLSSLRLVGRAELGIPGASRIGLIPGAGTGFIPDYYRDAAGYRGAVVRVNLFDLTVTDTIRVCSAPHHALPDPSGAFVAIACAGDDDIVLLDASTNAELRRFNTRGRADRPTRPLNLAWAPGSDTLFVTLHAANMVAAYTPAGDLVGQYPTGRGPAQLERTPAGILVVANRMDGSVSIGRPGSGTWTRLELGVDHPHGVAINGDGSQAVITFEGRSDGPGGAVGIDLATPAVTWTTIAGAYTLGVTVVTP